MIFQNKRQKERGIAPSSPTSSSASRRRRHRDNRKDQQYEESTSPSSSSSPRKTFNMRLRRNKNQRQQQQQSPSKQQQQQQSTNHENYYDKQQQSQRSPRFRVARGSNNKKKRGGVIDPTLQMQEMNVNETYSGYEVSLDAFKVEETREPMLRSPKGAASAPRVRRSRDEFKSPLLETIHEQLRQRQRVHRSQFSLDFPAISLYTQQQHNQSISKGMPSRNKADLDWRPKEHRIPLLGFSIPESSYEDVFQLLRSATFMDESKAVETELDEIDKELSALEDDRTWLEANWSTLMRTPSAPIPPPPIKKKTKRSSLDWDTSRLLDSPHALHSGEQLELQHNRGLCLSVRIQNYKARESFLAKCGYKKPLHSATMRSRHKQFPFTADVVTLNPDTCRVGGAGTTIQQVSVLSGSTSNANSSSFFMSRDNQKSTTWGHLPPKLFRRMKQDPGHDVSDLEYLSTGPRGCYYAQFRSGECWWGSAVEDNDFHSIVKKWDVYRVVFGPIVVMEDEFGKQRLTSSWIVLGRDGRAAWKNLPSRLHHRLESRLADRSAPAEITLGPGDSYYIKFLDGTVDYCLPAMIARVCEHIEMNGGVITNLSLHPENSHDFIIRHTDMR